MNKKKVIIIDDDPSYLEIMEMVIQDMGCETFTFTTWRSDTIQKIIDIFPDVIILDEWLIGVKGSELCVILKSINQLRRIPVVLISGVEGLEEIARKSLADAFVRKPFEIEEVERIVLQF